MFDDRFSCIFTNEVYYSQRYGWLKSRNSYTVCYEEDGGEKYGLTQYFLSLQRQVVAVVMPLAVTAPHYPGQLSILNDRMIPVVTASPVCVVSVKAFVC